jgi:hypothetical protein
MPNIRIAIAAVLSVIVLGAFARMAMADDHEDTPEITKEDVIAAQKE